MIAMFEEGVQHPVRPDPSTASAVKVCVPASRSAVLAEVGPELNPLPNSRRFMTTLPTVDPRVEAALADAVDRARNAARAQGYAEGYSQGRRAAEEELTAELSRRARQSRVEAGERAESFANALSALQAAGDRLSAAALRGWEPTADELARAAFVLTRELVGRELALAENPGLDAIARVLAQVPPDRPVVLRMHPATHAAVAQIPLSGEGRRVMIKADATIEVDGCVAECDATRIDAQIGPALRRLKAVLSP